ncbi:hypothetical protein D3C85_1434590 [compost metagenome]
MGQLVVEAGHLALAVFGHHLRRGHVIDLPVLALHLPLHRPRLRVEVAQLLRRQPLIGRDLRGLEPELLVRGAVGQQRHARLHRSLLFQPAQQTLELLRLVLLILAGVVGLRPGQHEAHKFVVE